MGDIGAGGCVDLEDEDWLGGVEDAEADEVLEEGDGLWDLASFWGCFLGMVKLDLVTRRAPVAWMGPGGKGDGAGVDGELSFLDCDEFLVGGAEGFLDVFESAGGFEDFFPLDEPFAALLGGDLFFALALLCVADVELDFSGDGAGSFTACFSSLGGAAIKNKIQYFTLADTKFILSRNKTQFEVLIEKADLVFVIVWLLVIFTA